MARKKVNSISFFRDDYTDFGETEPNTYAMFSDIADFIRIALKNNRKMKIWSDEYTVVIEYDYADPELSEYSLEWVGEDEYVGSYSEDEEEEVEDDND